MKIVKDTINYICAVLVILLVMWMLGSWIEIASHNRDHLISGFAYEYSPLNFFILFF